MSMAESWLAETDDALLSEPVVLMAAHSGPHSYMLLRPFNLLSLPPYSAHR